jgi:hypothetical protein
MRSVAFVALLLTLTTAGCGDTETPPDVAADDRFERTVQDLRSGAIELRVEGREAGTALVPRTCEYAVIAIREDTAITPINGIVVEIEPEPDCR